MPTFSFTASNNAATPSNASRPGSSAAPADQVPNLDTAGQGAAFGRNRRVPAAKASSPDNLVRRMPQTSPGPKIAAKLAQAGGLQPRKLHQLRNPRSTMLGRRSE